MTDATSSAEPKPIETPPTAPRVDFTDPQVRAEWLAAVHSAVKDLIAAARDATEAPGDRVLGRKGARDLITAARETLDSLFAATDVPVSDAPSLRATGKAPMIRTATTGNIERAWREVKRTCEHDEPLTKLSLTALLLVAVTGMPPEHTSGSPVATLLQTARAMVQAWALARSGSTLYASVPFVELDMLSHRLDVARELIRRGVAMRSSR